MILNLLTILLFYLFFLLAWFVIYLIGYFLVLAFKSEKAFGVLLLLQTLINYLVGFAVFIGGIFYLIQLFQQGNFLLLVLMLLFGFGLLLYFIGFITLPFTLVAVYFITKLEGKDFNENVVKAEILDAEGKVVGKTEGEVDISRRLAIFFLLNYGILILYTIIFPAEREGFGFLDYVVMPFIRLLVGGLLTLIPYSIYRLIRYRKLKAEKVMFFTQILKINLIIYLILFILLYLVGLADPSL